MTAARTLMSISVVRWLILMIVWGLVGASPAWSTTGEVLPRLAVVGRGELNPIEQAVLQGLLVRVPRRLYANLREIHLDGAGFDPQAMDMINCVSGRNLHGVCAHELGHQIDVAAPTWIHAWATELIAEAGCEPSAYVRSMLPRCYFQTFPQEFIASMVGEWLTDSRAMMERALAQHRLGNHSPLNQLILVMALFGQDGFVLAYAPGQYGSLVSPWHVWPWQCEGSHWIISASETWQIELNAACRVQ